MAAKNPGRPAASVLVVPPLGALILLVVLAPFEPFAAVTTMFFLLPFALVYVLLGQLIRRKVWTAPRLRQPLAAQIRQTGLFSAIALLAWIAVPAVTIVSETGQVSQSSPLSNFGQLLTLTLPVLLAHVVCVAGVVAATNRRVPERA